MLFLYNTLTRKKEIFKPVKDKKAGIYSCGPTVYSSTHLGNLRTYIFSDVLKRVLIYKGYKVKQVMNITDVGHLTSDADTGEDKVEKAAKKEKKTAWQIAEHYTKIFFNDTRKLNIIKPEIVAKATDQIKEDILLIKALEEKGFTYKTKDGLYFDTSKFKNYGALTGLSFSELKKNLKAGSRVEFSPEKKNITDFSLWKFSPPTKQRQMEWDSPWGKGFPGWHLECAVINLKYLGRAYNRSGFFPEKAQTIDIHTGGKDHINIHHSNEIAQAEAATGKKFVNFWLHGEFLVFKNLRMGKSEGNAVLIKDLEEKKYPPLAFRYLVLMNHYRKPLEFSWESLTGAKNALDNLYNFVLECQEDKKNKKAKKTSKTCAFLIKNLKKDFEAAINDDLNTPQALAVLWNLINSYSEAKKKSNWQKNINPKEIYKTILQFDKILGLRLNEVKPIKLPLEIKKIIKEREVLRKNKEWEKADRLRKAIENKDFFVQDAPEGTKIRIKNPSIRLWLKK